LGQRDSVLRSLVTAVEARVRAEEEAKAKGGLWATWRTIAEENLRLVTEVHALLQTRTAERDAARAEVERLRAAGEIFASYITGLEAAVELGEVDPFDEHAVVTGLSVGGGSIALTVAHFRALRAALSTEAAQ